MRSTFVSVSLTLLTLVHVACSASADEWRTRSVYQIMTDRFARPDGSTTASCNTTAVDYCGGTWRGLINKLDYIHGMGFSAVWISPITTQIPQTTPYGQPYTGYWQTDMYSINEIWGTLDDLHALAKALHDRDMYLMVDTIVNDFAFDGPGKAVDYSKFDPFNNQEFFHPFCLIQNYSNPIDATTCWLGDNTVSLPDLKTEDPTVVKMFSEWIPQFVKNYSIDGLRIDAVKHVDKPFFPPFLKAAGGLYAVGEEYEGDPKVACDYQNYMDGIANYPVYFPALRAFQNDTGSMDALAEAITNVSALCKDPTLLGSFSENHDVPRFASYTQDLALAKNMLAFTILQDGIPLIYQGQEQHYKGGANPANREALWLSGFNTGAPLYKLTAALNRIRNHAILVSPDVYINYPSQVLYTDSNTIALMKGNIGEQVITVLSNKGDNSGAYQVSLPVGFTPGEQVIDLIGCQRYNISEIGELTFQITNGLPMAFYGVNHMAGVKLCGDDGRGGPEGVLAGTAKNTTGSNPNENSGAQVSISAFSWLFIVALGFVLFR